MRALLEAACLGAKEVRGVPEAGSMGGVETLLQAHGKVEHETLKLMPLNEAQEVCLLIMALFSGMFMGASISTILKPEAREKIPYVWLLGHLAACWLLLLMS